MLPVGWGGGMWGGSQEGFRCPFSSTVPQDSGSYFSLTACHVSPLLCL